MVIDPQTYDIVMYEARLCVILPLETIVFRTWKEITEDMHAYLILKRYRALSKEIVIRENIYGCYWYKVKYTEANQQVCGGWKAYHILLFRLGLCLFVNCYFAMLGS